MKKLATGAWDWPRYTEFIAQFAAVYQAVEPTVASDFDYYAADFPTRQEIMAHYQKSWYQIKQAAGLAFLPQQLATGELLNCVSEIFTDDGTNLTALMRYGITPALLTARFGSVDRVYQMLNVKPTEQEHDFKGETD